MQTYRSRPVRDVGRGVLFPLVLVLGGFAEAVDPGEGTPGTGPGYIAAGAVIAAAGVVLAISQLASIGDGQIWSQHLLTR